MRSRIFSIDQENHLYQKKLCQIVQLDLQNFDKRAVLWKPLILKYLDFVGICICSWVVLLLVFRVYHKTYTSKLLHSSALYDFYCLFSHFVFSLYPVYTVFLQYCYLDYLFLAIAFFPGQFEFLFLQIDIKIIYLHLAMAQIQCIPT